MKNVIDSGTVLDYALFQLTPTRTRCDLVIFAGKKSEKIASGLLDPFLSHLKSARDEISKGGYSITLQPTSPDDSSWFTKATLERFVRFVSTPEVLERFVSLEKEIGQIQRSIETNEQEHGKVELQGDEGDPRAPIVPSKSKTVESNGRDDPEAEEKPKVRLQRVLKTRKTILEKELAMAYARALVAGFEMDYLRDLVSFSDAFGALRFREACINFMEICDQKNNDKIWMDEVAAVQASYIVPSGIIPSFENNDLPQNAQLKNSTPDSITRQGSLDTSEGTENGSSVEFNLQQTEGAGAQLPKSRNNFPQFMPNPQGPYPVFQQMPPPYPGYMFPGFQVAPSHYPPNMSWPGNFLNPNTYPPDRDLKKKDYIRSDSSEEEENEQELERSLSGSEEHVHKKNSSKRSSRKVVIRNINYIAGGRNEEKGSEFVDADSIKQHVEAAFGSLKKHQKSKDHHSQETEDFEAEDNNGNWDAFQTLLVKDSESRSEDTVSKTIHESYGEALNQKSRPKYGNDDFLFTERSSTGIRVEGAVAKFEGGGEYIRGVVTRSNGEDLLIPSRGDYPTEKAFLGTESSIVRPQKEQDWLVGVKQEASAGQYRGVDHGDQVSGDYKQIREREKEFVLDDSFMVHSGLSEIRKETHPKADVFMDSEIVGAPEDLQKNVEVSKYSEPEDLYMLIGRETSVVSSWSPEMDNGKGVQKKVDPVKESAKKVEAKEASPIKKAPIGRSKSAVPTRSKIPVSGNGVIRNKSNNEEERRKKMEELMIERQKRIAERTAARFTKKPVPAQAPPPPKEKPKITIRSSTIDRLATARTPIKRQPLAESKPGVNRKPSPKGTVTPSPSLKKTTTKVVNPPDKRTNKVTGDQDQARNGGNDIVKDLHTVTSVEKKITEATPLEIASDIRPSQEATPVTVSPPSASNAGDEKKEMDISTPDSENDALAHSRKKWVDGETSSPKAPKGFRKLLLFGHRN